MLNKNDMNKNINKIWGNFLPIWFFLSRLNVVLKTCMTSELNKHQISGRVEWEAKWSLRTDFPE